MTARERLWEWIKRNKMTQHEAADLLEMHFTHFNQILNGRRSPGLRNAIRIQRATGIAVDCWLPTPSAQIEKTAAPQVEAAK